MIRSQREQRLIARIWEHSDVERVEAQTVYEGDAITVVYGSEPRVTHNPANWSDRPTQAYAVATRRISRGSRSSAPSVMTVISTEYLDGCLLRLTMATAPGSTPTFDVQKTIGAYTKGAELGEFLRVIALVALASKLAIEVEGLPAAELPEN